MWSSNRTPTSPWRGAQSVPRQLKLKRFPEGLRLVQQPVSEIEGLRDQSLRLEDLSVVEANRAIAVAGFRGDVLELRAEIEVRDSSDVGFRILQGPSVETLVGFTAVPAEVYVDRTKSGEADFHESFAGRHSARLDPENGAVDLRILVDRSVVEVFAGHGRVAITDRVFPRPGGDGLTIYSTGGEARIVSLNAWKLRSGWE